MNIVTLLFPIIIILVLAGFSGLIKVETFNSIFGALVIILILYAISKAILNSSESKSFSQPVEHLEQEDDKQEIQTEITGASPTQSSQTESKDTITWGQN